MKVLVTGGAGFIGSNIVKELQQRGNRVYVLDDFSHANYQNILNVSCEVIFGDVSDALTIKKLPKVDAVIHEAAITDTTLPDNSKMMKVNYQGFLNILQYCVKHNTRLVYASSAGVYGAGKSPMSESQDPVPLNTYAYSKLLCDHKVSQLFHRKDMPCIVGLRYFNVYGPGEYHKGKAASMIYQLYLQMKSGKAPRVFKFGEQRRDFVYVKDVVNATIGALRLSKSQILNVGTGQARSFNEIIASLNAALQTSFQPEYFDNPYSAAYQDNTQADISRLTKSIKNVPHYSLEEGISEYATCYLLNNKME